jgi:N6-adenosine-specific RNA methylase IME4
MTSMPIQISKEPAGAGEVGKGDVGAVPVKQITEMVSAEPLADAVTPDKAINVTEGIRYDFASLTAHFADHGYPVPHPFVQLFPRATSDEQRALTESVRQHGVRDAVTVFDDRTADGVSRCLAGIELGIGWEELPKTQYEGDETSLLQLVIDKNLNRRHLNESQRAMVAARLATMSQGARTDIAQICAMSQQQAADQLNIGRRLVQYAGDVLTHGAQELQDAVNSGTLAVSAAVDAIKLPPEKQRDIIGDSLKRPNPAKAFAMAIRNAEADSRHRQILTNARRYDLRGQRYTILLTDVPWEGRVSRVGSPFSRLSIEQICEFRLDDGRLIREVMADNAILAMWILDAILLSPERPWERILQAWGDFKPHHLMSWPKSSFRTGHFARYQHEMCLVCTRGNFPPPPEHLRQSTLIVGPRLEAGDGFHLAPPHDGRHSSKTDRLPEMIEQAYPQYFGPETVASPLALEVFARNYRPRWDGQGFEYPGRPDHEGQQIELRRLEAHTRIDETCRNDTP